jgi:hypothetical protein
MKYVDAIKEWSLKPTHTLHDTQKLYGKLLHSYLVIPAGCVYLTSLESMLSICSNCPFVPHHPVQHLKYDDLIWWQSRLVQSLITHSISLPSSLIDLRAFSDASTSISIAVVINGHWHAWSLCPDWKTHDGQQDIGWAKCVGFELLIHAILDSHQDRTFHLYYIPTGNNPADGPSRGIFLPCRFLLLPILLPSDLSKFIVDANLSLTQPQPSFHYMYPGIDELDNEAENWGEKLW